MIMMMVQIAYNTHTVRTQQAQCIGKTNNVCGMCRECIFTFHKHVRVSQRSLSNALRCWLHSLCSLLAVFQLIVVIMQNFNRAAREQLAYRTAGFGGFCCCCCCRIRIVARCDAVFMLCVVHIEAVVITCSCTAAGLECLQTSVCGIRMYRACTTVLCAHRIALLLVAECTWRMWRWRAVWAPCEAGAYMIFVRKWIKYSSYSVII